MIPEANWSNLSRGSKHPRGQLAELLALGIKWLQTKAATVGTSGDAIEDARDSDDPKDTLIDLILS